MTLDPLFLSRPIAHRGYHHLAGGVPENSLAAFRAAIAAGYGIELDVQPSADGIPMVFHDDTLERLVGGDGPVTARSAAELGRMAILGTSDRVPTLSEVLADVAGRAPLLIEIKDQSRALAPVDGKLEAAVAAVLKDYRGPVALMSFNPHSVAALAQVAPDIPRGLTTCGYDQDWWEDRLPEARRHELQAIPDYAPTGSVFVSHEHGDLGRPRIAELKRQGAAILCWTIRTPEAEAVARRVADNVTFEGYSAAVAP